MNIYDIAREAGVSISTVSRVLNDHPNVRSATRNRVNDVLREHNYVRSAVAKSLVSKSTGTIGVMALDVRHLHYANISFAVEQELSLLSYNVVLCNTGYDRSKMEDYLRVLAEKRVDGIIMIGSIFSNAEIERGIRRYVPNTPVVMHNSTLEATNVYNVSTEDPTGMALSVNHLASIGCERIAFIQDYDTPVGFAKHDVYRRELEKFDLPYDPRRVVRTLSGLEGGMQAVVELADRGVSFDALMGCDDITALGAIRRLKEMGQAVPEDVAVVGVNNTVFSQLSDPQMTVVDNREEMTGITLARTLTDVLRGREVPAISILVPELVIRHSA